jgi:hypothetical protein
MGARLWDCIDAQAEEFTGFGTYRKRTAPRFHRARRSARFI